MSRIAIIGAGLSGILLARELSEKADVVLFEKARGLGGRMSTRHAERFSFDHGVPFFTARTVEFQSFLAPYIHTKTIALWTGQRIELGAQENKEKKQGSWTKPHWVATPNINSLCTVLAKGLDVRLNCEVAGLEKKKKQAWQLLDKERAVLGDFDQVISTAPAPQTIKLFDRYLSVDRHLLYDSPMKPCYTLMLGFHSTWHEPWIAAEVHQNPIASIFVNSSKPGRDASVTCLVVQSTNVWAEERINDEKEAVQKFLFDQLSSLTGINASAADYSSLHLWRYAISGEEKPKVSSYLDSKLGLAATGDWCSGSSIEDLWIHTKKTAADIADAML